MTQELTFPNSHLEFAKILKDNNNCISTTLSFFEQNFQIDFEERKQLEATLLRVRSRIRKAKKSLDCLEGDWWHCGISMEPELKRNRFYDTVELSSDDEEVISTLSANHRKSIDNLTMQQQRSRLSNVLESIKALSIVENTSEIKIAALALQLLSNQTKQREIAKVSKSVVYDKFSGQFGKLLKKELDVTKTVFLLDLLEIGRRKYTQLRYHLLSSDIRFPAYYRIVEETNSIILRSDIQMYPNPETPLGAYVHATATSSQDFPLQFQIADGLDGSGSHTVYNQSNTNTDTKSFILFCIRAVKVISNSGRELWKNNTPNSPFAQRPIFLLAAKENEANIKRFMDDLINTDTDLMRSEGFTLGPDQQVRVDIVRSMLDGKMAGILSGAGGASCQLCTATHKELNDRELIIQGFPINRYITDAIQLFGEIEDSHSFFSLPSNQRCNITHEPTSTINILPASPLHSYTGIFRWFNLLIYHLNCGKRTWSPTSLTIKNSMIFVRNLIEGKTGMRIDQPNASGGTSSTGSVARRAFSCDSKYFECVLSVVETEHKETLSKLQTHLSAILRITLLNKNFVAFLPTLVFT
ncbi:hypothetical protein LOD99_1799 [Oopsacas minuta]|uniref:V(D)J recombination-activating protein 1 RNase H domain-containing protein n=1 Tax=Oopsacas minuta TaxID=111878 RepID=A0AAV7K4N1_9METZ|nr:hypothetical protein LOD99_1799 [Oopsacas minuta]